MSVFPFLLLNYRIVDNVVQGEKLSIFQNPNYTQYMWELVSPAHMIVNCKNTSKCYILSVYASKRVIHFFSLQKVSLSFLILFIFKINFEGWSSIQGKPERTGGKKLRENNKKNAGWCIWHLD